MSYSFSVMVDFVMAPLNFMVVMETGKKSCCHGKYFLATLNS